MTGFGSVITPEYFPTVVESVDLNVPYYRSILYEIADLETLKTLNKPLVITLNNQCKEVGLDWSGWDKTVQEIGLRCGKQLLMLGCGNEFDLYWQNNNNDVPPTFAASLAIRASRILHPMGIKVAPTSLAGAYWPDYLESLYILCGSDVDYFDIHPYGKRPTGWKDDQAGKWMFGDLADTVQHVQNLTGKPFICTEYGVKIQDAGSEQEVANFLQAAYSTLESYNVPIKCWFAYCDAIGTLTEQGTSAFGMKSSDGRYRPAWSTFSMINKTQSPTNDLSKWKGLVGDGILTMMAQNNTEPVMASEWRPFNRGPNVPATVELCIAKNGDNYQWLLPENKGYIIRATLAYTQ